MNSPHFARAASPPRRETAFRPEPCRAVSSQQLADVFPDSAHVARYDLAETGDRAVWEFAGEHGFTIVSNDSDFSELSFLYGAPPKAVWVRVGNGPTALIEALLRELAAPLDAFAASSTDSFIVLGRDGLVADR